MTLCIITSFKSLIYLRRVQLLENLHCDTLLIIHIIGFESMNTHIMMLTLNILNHFYISFNFQVKYTKHAIHTTYPNPSSRISLFFFLFLLHLPPMVFIIGILFWHSFFFWNYDNFCFIILTIICALLKRRHQHTPCHNRWVGMKRWKKRGGQGAFLHHGVQYHLSCP